MVDQIRKTLRKLSGKEQNTIKDTIKKIIADKLAGLDVKKLKGRDDVYRVRKGKIRIIFRKLPGENNVIAIERRSDTTYHN